MQNHCAGCDKWTSPPLMLACVKCSRRFCFPCLRLAARQMRRTMSTSLVSEDRGTLAIQRVCHACAAELLILDDKMEISPFTGKLVVVDELGGRHELQDGEGRGPGLCQSIRGAGGAAPGDGPGTERGVVVRDLSEGSGDVGSVFDGSRPVVMSPVRRRSLRERWEGLKAWFYDLMYEFHKSNRQ